MSHTAQGQARLILIKHAMPEIDESVSSHQWRLSEQGRLDAAKLANVLVPYAPQALASSPEPKAIETGLALSRELDLSCESAPGLQENDRSGLPYLSDDDYLATFRHFFEEPNELVVGRETARQATDRFTETLDGVIARHADRTIAVVAHGTVISLWLQRAVGIDPFSLWQRLDLPSYVVLTLPDLTIERVVESLNS